MAELNDGGATILPTGTGTLTGLEIAQRAWRITKEIDPSCPRVDDTLMLDYVNSALAALAADRPDLLLSTDGSTVSTFIPLTSLGELTQFETNRKKTLASYVVYEIYLEDSQDDRNAKMAEMHFRTYEEGVLENV